MIEAASDSGAAQVVAPDDGSVIDALRHGDEGPKVTFAPETRRALQARAWHASEVRNSEKMWPMGWEVLEQWGDDVARIEPLAGGVANDVWSVRVKRAPRGRSARRQERR